MGKFKVEDRVIVRVNYPCGNPFMFYKGEVVDIYPDGRYLIFMEKAQDLQDYPEVALTLEEDTVGFEVIQQKRIFRYV